MFSARRHALRAAVRPAYLAAFGRKGEFLSLTFPADFDESDLLLNRALLVALSSLEVNEGGQPQFG